MSSKVLITLVFGAVIRDFYFLSLVELLDSHFPSYGFQSILEISFPISAHMGGEMNVAY